MGRNRPRVTSGQIRLAAAEVQNSRPRKVAGNSNPEEEGVTSSRETVGNATEKLITRECSTAKVSVRILTKRKAPPHLSKNERKTKNRKEEYMKNSFCHV